MRIYGAKLKLKIEPKEEEGRMPKEEEENNAIRGRGKSCVLYLV
jgi:hypothetical protein